MNRRDAEILINDFEDAVRDWEQRPTKRNREDLEAAREKIITSITAGQAEAAHTSAMSHSENER